MLFSFVAVALLVMAVRGGAYVLLAWPALSFGIVSITYFTNEARWFGKRGDGSRHWLATAALLPYITFAHAVWRMQVFLSREPAISLVNDSLAVSRRLLAHEVPADVDVVCDLTCELVDPESVRAKPGYCCHPILDAGACAASELIALARRLPPSSDRRLLIHCANGHGRTGMFAAVWLLTHGFAETVDDSLATLQTARPGIGLRTRQRRLVAEAYSLLRDSHESGVVSDRGGV
ncbi:MAG: hypothetical protein KF777_07800 [Planctomycetaceae bacterium]|nr:hypothetical protein [Planctomycetaceae bacterium]